MFSLEDGIPIGEIMADRKIKSRIIYLQEQKDDKALREITHKYSLNDDEIDNLKKIIMKGENEPMRNFKSLFLVWPLPRFDMTERLYVAGPSGSGKSHYIAEYLKRYRRIYKNKQIYLFSGVDDDKVLDDIGITRIKLDEEITDTNLLVPDRFRDSICVFDDVDSIPIKAIKNSLTKFRDSLLMRGRHEDITTISSNHLLTNYQETRVVLSEATSITIFPMSGASHGNVRILTTYCGLNKKQVSKIMDLGSRWVTIYKNYPMYCFHEHGCFFL
jgi:hypothetical protein